MSRLIPRPLVLAAVLVSGLLAAVPASMTAGAAESTLCCFNNWRFSGTCIAQRSGDQKCRDILSVLNNLQAAAVTYCGGTQVRGGWTEVDCGGGGGGGSVNQGVDLSSSFITPVEPSVTAPARRARLGEPDGVPRSGSAVTPSDQSFITPTDAAAAPEAGQPSLLSF